MREPTKSTSLPVLTPLGSHTTRLSTAREPDRRSYIGGSDARVIMGADEAALSRLWKEKRGEVEPKDFTRDLVVQLGCVTEALNRRWFEQETGRRLKAVQKFMRHKTVDWLGATLDGMVAEDPAVFEAKFMLPWSFSEEG